MAAIRPHCYSQRMLNPFRGVMNVIELGDADAVTIDGVKWVLYLRDEALQGMANDGDMAVEIIDIRFGSWTAKDGLKRAPLLTTMEYDAIQHAGEHLLEVVKEYADKVPFSLRDNYELWLLDKYLDRPLALLHSVCFASDLFEPNQISWTPGLLCEQTFNSGHLDNIQLAEQAEINHATWLREHINKASGSRQRAQWFLRNEDGSGSLISRLPRLKNNRSADLPREAFPSLMLNREWLDHDLEAVTQDYLSWQAPWLLLLQEMSDSTRAWLESLACKQATRLSSQQRLYPRILDQEKIDAALVESMLRNANEYDQEDCSAPKTDNSIAGQYY